MRPRRIRQLAGVAVLFAGAAAWCATAAPDAHADYFGYPCNYPFVGDGGNVNIIITAGGQYCDGPMEINGSHYHCEAGGGGIGGGAIGLAPSVGGLSIGGFGGSGVGGHLERCRFRCPDGTDAPFPNPPAAWIRHLVLDDRYNDCRDHMNPQGDTSTPQSPESGPADGADTTPAVPEAGTPIPGAIP